MPDERSKLLDNHFSFQKKKVTVTLKKTVVKPEIPLQELNKKELPKLENNTAKCAERSALITNISSGVAAVPAFVGGAVGTAKVLPLLCSPPPPFNMVCPIAFSVALCTGSFTFFITRSACETVQQKLQPAEEPVAKGKVPSLQAMTRS